MSAPLRLNEKTDDLAISTSPSVYAIYQDLVTRKFCSNTAYTGTSYGPHYQCMWCESPFAVSFNIMFAYEPDALSTRAVCNTAIPNVTRAINYTELQYGITTYDYATCPIHTLLWSPHTQLVWPAGLTEGTVLDPSWRTCTPIQIGVFDPPRTLNKATAMAPEGPFPAKPPVPAPAAQITPANAPATPTPNSKGPTNNAPQPAPPIPPADPGPNFEPKETGVPGPQGPPLSSDPTNNRPASGESHGADPPSDSTPQNDTPQTKTPSATACPSTTHIRPKRKPQLVVQATQILLHNQTNDHKMVKQIRRIPTQEQAQGNT